MGAWDFIGIDSKPLTHGMHLYPAIMNPHVARRLIKNFGVDGGVVLDPFCGSGTTLVEAKLQGMMSVGFDLNPLAREISKAKTQSYDILKLDKFIMDFSQKLETLELITLSKAVKQSGFDGDKIKTWFPNRSIREIASVLTLINDYKEVGDKEKLFVKTALSDCIRKVSLQRMNEWKNYRISGWQDMNLDDQYQPLFPILKEKLFNNFNSCVRYVKELGKRGNLKIKTHIFEENSVFSSNFSGKPEKGFDLVVTSPPYGDSRTTVAYAEFSWMINVWLGLDKRPPGRLGKEMMGGKIKDSIQKIGCRTIDRTIAKMDEKIAMKNHSFYCDYLKSIENISKSVKDGGIVCYVVGNRTSGGRILRLDLFTRWAFEQNGFRRIGTIKKRRLPNTKMPNAISSSGTKGKKIVSTMNNEYIIVCKKVI